MHVDKHHGTNVLGPNQIEQIKKGGILINAAFPEAVDLPSVHARLKKGDIFAAFDNPVFDEAEDIVTGHYLASNAQTAFNNMECNKAISDSATISLINLLTTGQDTNLVNPEYVKHRRL